VFHESEENPRYRKVQKGRDRHGKRPIGRANQRFNWRKVYIQKGTVPL
jgi:hypothetical protein